MLHIVALRTLHKTAISRSHTLRNLPPTHRLVSLSRLFSSVMTLKTSLPGTLSHSQRAEWHAHGATQSAGVIAGLEALFSVSGVLVLRMYYIN